MRYVMLFISASDDIWSKLLPEEMQRVMGEINTWWGEHAAAGRIVGGERLQGGATATTLRGAGGGQSIIDGPYVEAKEEVSGFGLLEVEDLDAALAIARTWPALQVEGEAVEVRPAWVM